MSLDVIPFHDARKSPLALPLEWNDPNLQFCDSVLLRNRIAEGGLDPTVLDHPIAGFDETAAELDRLYVSTLTAAYHDAAHARAVSHRFRRYLAAAGASESVQQLGFLAGLMHDAGHPGERYREDAHGIEHPELSNEEYAAASALERLATTLNTTQLTWVYGVVTATSFGQKAGKDPAVNAVLEARPHLVRPYGPVTPHQFLLHLADINSTGGGDGFDEFMSGGVKLRREAGRGAALVDCRRTPRARAEPGGFPRIHLVRSTAHEGLLHREGFSETLRGELAGVEERVRHVISV